ncbi:QueT transporter family protein [Dolosicoccus paucivorans]|uniref:QueT transporter family protein n=1 Tax=Dolosicoccus paucivorans TaxID=84521 RepID=A0A2N6SLI5_9LACT|nr:QueT transporter family protein [Dolosicoccus paucivorans]PMB83796.1 QueT transporter family protein [Dolosicoccus paucivorans]PMC57925.1 QueT transporter family protein [Dolosicoccus paucivorans]
MKTNDLVKGGIVAAIYIVLTLLVAPVAFGPVQFRISEGLNFLGLYNRRYIIAITLGVFLVNMANGPIDMVVGTLHTVLSLILGRYLAKKVTERQQNSHRITQYAIMTLVFSVMMFIIAYMLVYLLHFEEAFWFTYGTLFLSELIAMALGAFIMLPLSARIDFEE